MSREAATSFQWIFKDDGYGIVRYRAATKIAQLSGEIRRAFGTVPRRLEPAVRNRHEPAELNLGETIAWKILQGESFGWASQRVLAPPPLLPANSTLKRSNQSRIPTQPQYTASRKTWFRTYVQRDHHSGNIPKQARLHTPIKVATWNIEGLYELKIRTNYGIYDP